jgi:hypothetical protein
VTFNPSAPGSPTPTTIDGANGLSGLACPSVSQCTAVDRGGREVTFDPRAPGTPTAVTVDQPYLVSIQPGGSLPPQQAYTSVAGVDCPSVAQCTVVDSGGREVTFDPTAPGTPTADTVDPTYNVGGTVGSTWVTAVACAAVWQCTAVDSIGNEVTFDPSAPGKPTPTNVTVLPILYRGFAAVTCPSVSQCSAVGGGGEVTFDPQAPGPPARTPIDEGDSMTALACPSLAQCTAVDLFGNEVTFDPRTPCPAARVMIDPGGVGFGYVPPPNCGSPTVVNVPPPSLASPPPTPVTPQITRITQSHARWREGRALASFSRSEPRSRSAHGREPTVGTTFGFSLNEQAIVTFRFTRSLPGREVGHGCVAQTKANRHRPSCTRTITEGTLSFSGHSGVNYVAFQGRISRAKKLGLGSYTLTITATSSTGQRSQPRSLSFTIVG